MLPTARRLLPAVVLALLIVPVQAAHAEPFGGARSAKPRTVAAPAMQQSGMTMRRPPAAPQWHLSAAEGTDAVGAWRTTDGGDVLVAVIDSGIDLAVPDLAPNAWTNPGEIAGNGIDDDANGYVDDVHGWDFVGKDADPADENGHGTHVAGLLAARGANARGVAGVARRAQVMALRVLDRDNDGSSTDVAAAVRYAVAEGARVVNLSLNSEKADPDLEAALAEAEAADVLVVVAAGNAAADLDATPTFPACSAQPNVIAVAALTRAGGLAGFSNRGSACVNVAAPGEALLSTSRGRGYAPRSGTSMAAPQVAGAAVLLLAARPDLRVAQLRNALIDTAAPLRSPAGGLRRLDVRAALAAAV